MLSLSEKIIILLILISSQVFIGNILISITFLSISSLIILFLYYADFKKFGIPIFFIGVLILSFFTIVYQFSDTSSFIRQLARVFYPWLLLIIYHLLVIKNVKNVEKMLSIVKFTSFSILIILIPDFISLIYTFLKNPNYLIILKLSSITYRETNTTAFLLLYSIIFRLENNFSNLKERIFTISALFLTFSRSSILFFFVYSLYKLGNLLIKKISRFNFKLFFSRTFPFLVLIIMLAIWKFSGIQMLADSGYSVSLNDRSFITRILMFDYLSYYFSTIDLSELSNFMFGYGWIDYNEVLRSLPFKYEGITGHTILGVLPEYGFLYTSLIFFFFYFRAFKGQITDTIMLGLGILAFFPFPYLAPILCLAHSHRKFIKKVNANIN